MDYMMLLVAELQNQNPMEPLDNQAMASQLAQFSQLQQMENMNSSFAEVLTTVEHAYASSLIGKEVSFLTTTETGSVDFSTGTVDQVCTDPEGGVLLDVGGNLITLEEIVSVKD
jgi:flagellar basal-body rod modification protein FlgD